MADADASVRAGTRVFAIVGPTGVGKTAVAQAIASAVRGGIVSADSMQVYRGMDIGTAKPPPAERSVPHLCLDLVDPGDPYSAALYQADARQAIDGLAARGLTPIVCGGTGLYVRAALDDWCFPAGERDGEARGRMEALAVELGPEGLHARLAELDPDAGALIHPNNVRRVVRALEMLAQGRPYSEQARGFSGRESVYDARFLGLDMDREALYARIDARVDAMVASGLLDEVRGLLQAGYREALLATQAIGYKELVGVLEEGSDPGEAIEQVKRASRRYAKRQLSWFRADRRVRWLDVTGLDVLAASDRGLALLES